MTRARGELLSSAEHLLAEIAGRKDEHKRRRPVPRRDQDIAALLAAGLLARNIRGGLEVTRAGIAHLARKAHARRNSHIDPFRAQHLDLAERPHVSTDHTVTFDEAESPLAWLARRKGSDGRPHIAPAQLQAGECLRAEFTRAQLMPRTTSNWNAPVSDDRRGVGAPATFTESVIAARQRLRRALDAVGPELSGLLVDVCCFLKGLADVEHERGWPPRSAKVVLQLGLDRLARHYGLSGEARGQAHARIRTWLAPDTPVIDEG